MCMYYILGIIIINAGELAIKNMNEQRYIVNIHVQVATFFFIFFNFLNLYVLVKGFPVNKYRWSFAFIYISVIIYF